MSQAPDRATAYAVGALLSACLDAELITAEEAMDLACKWVGSEHELAAMIHGRRAARIPAIDEWVRGVGRMSER